jgi:hypothetical protein
VPLACCTVDAAPPPGAHAPNGATTACCEGQEHCSSTFPSKAALTGALHHDKLGVLLPLTPRAPLLPTSLLEMP